MNEADELTQINVYSDESRHLKGQGPSMVIGSLWCEEKYVSEASDKIALIRAKHNIAPHREIKWTKVSRAKLPYYQDLIQYFFEDDRLNFRAVVIPTERLDHDSFSQTAEDFYYKMQYVMLINIVRKIKANFKIYLDYKDSWSYSRSQELTKYLKHKIDFIGRDFVAQPVRSYESALLQLADLLIGAVAAKNSGEAISDAKQSIVDCIESYALQSLDAQTPIGVDKINIFLWQPQER